MAQTSPQLLLPLPPPARPNRIEDPKAAEQLGAKLGRALRYLTIHLAGQKPLEMTMIRALSQFILKTERTQMSETARKSFEHGLRSVRSGHVTKAVTNAKLLILLSILKREDPFFGDYAPLTTTSNPQTFFAKLASLMIGLDRLITRYETGQNPTCLEAVLELEKTLWALEAFFPWARTLFPEETRALNAKLAAQGLTVRDFIADGKTRVANARRSLHRIQTRLP